MNDAVNAPANSGVSVDLSWRALWRDGVLQRFLVLAFGAWLHAANSTLTATLIPTAVRDIGGVAFLSWTMVLYQVGSIVAAAAVGLLVLRFGLRSAMIFAAALYLVGCLIAAAAPSMNVLLVGRFAQGAGGGALVALIHVSLAQLFPPAYMPRLIAIISALWGVSAFCGPLVGGFFAELYSWRAGFWAFAFQAGLYICALVFIMRASDQRVVSATSSAQVVSLPKVRLAILGTAILSVASGGVMGFSALGFVIALVGGGLLAAFFMRDRGAGATRLYPMSFYRRGNPTQTGLFAMVLLFFATVAFTVYGPFLAQQVYGIGPLASGMLVALESVCWSLAAVFFSGASPSWQPILIRIGSSLAVLNVVGLALIMGLGGPDLPIWTLFPILVAGGAAFGMCHGFMIQRIVGGADKSDRALASSAVPTTQMISYSLGGACCGFVANGLALTTDTLPHAAANIAFWLFASFVPIAVLGMICAWRLTGKEARIEQ